MNNARAVAFVTLLTTSMAANAADLPVKAPPPGPMPLPFSWSGFYIGANVGGAWSSGWSSTADPVPSPEFVGVSPMRFDNNASGAIGGGQIGYNWQSSPNWLFGFEADFQGANLKGGSTISPVPGFPTGLLLNSSAFMNRELDWFGTVRGRVGLTYDRWLVYGTAGFAYGEVKGSADNTFLASTILNPSFQVNFPASFSHTKTGWTAGGGVEYALPGAFGSWTLRAEYLFVSLSGDSVTGLPSPAAFVPPPTAFLYSWSKTDFHVARFGLNYKL